MCTFNRIMDYYVQQLSQGCKWLGSLCFDFPAILTVTILDHTETQCSLKAQSYCCGMLSKVILLAQGGRNHEISDILASEVI